MIRDHNRYSRWAIAAAAAAVAAISNFAAISLFGPIKSNTAYVPDIATFGISLGIIACGPASLVLAKMALWDIRRRPYLRGGLLAELCIIIGCLAISFEIALAILFMALHFSGGLYV